MLLYFMIMCYHWVPKGRLSTSLQGETYIVNTFIVAKKDQCIDLMNLPYNAQTDLTMWVKNVARILQFMEIHLKYPYTQTQENYM